MNLDKIFTEEELMPEDVVISEEDKNSFSLRKMRSKGLMDQYIEWLDEDYMTEGVVKVKLNFGKYSGEDIEDVPCDYLQWLYENFEVREYNDEDEELMEALEEEIQYREDNGIYIPGDYEIYE